ncbi:chromate efflux transporter [Paenibacillus daejeonensis]|uniref:chromate efflux transporter n=1 Tax=Paenibacillus daejeonensis TaxID=135193 RepID=UPI0003A55549|nr:chromate efflux transporter [Paenibacillus daejeonensis]
MKPTSATSQRHSFTRIWEVFVTALMLGLSSFGGPAAHLGYFHQEYVKRRRWIDERAYAELISLCQLLPGPASSQAGAAIGVVRAGLWGGVAAWVGFTLPSAVVMALFAMLLVSGDLSGAGWLHGLKITAVVIVAHAVLGMGGQLARGPMRGAIAAFTAGVMLLWPSASIQLVLLVLAGLCGWLWLGKRDDLPPTTEMLVPVSRATGRVALGLAFGLFLLLPLLASFYEMGWLAIADSFYRSGSLVFGGGHVVLPLLEREVVPAGWVSEEQFLAGYAAAQAVPGPLFTFASYLGGIWGGWSGAVLATLAIFLPGLLLVIGALPFWHSWRQQPAIQSALAGVGPAVVGLLIAAWYNPIFTSAILQPADAALAILLYLFLAIWKLPPWLVVLAGAGGGMLLTMI